MRSQIRRHTSKWIAPAVSIRGGEKRRQYVARASKDLHFAARVVDLGMYAGTTSNACFWLSLAAALTRSTWAPRAYLRSSLSGFDAAVTSAIPTNVQEVRHSEVGALAVQLRHHMCLGDGAAMLQPHVRDMIYQAFAALDAGGPSRTLDQYKRWVAKLAVNEFADELVVRATAIELRVRITCVPYTPPGRPDWVIAQYAPVGYVAPESKTVVLGNDDVHYVWLSAATS